MKLKILICCLVGCLVLGCRPQKAASIPQATNTSDSSDTTVTASVYYWKTTFSLNHYEKQFLQTNGIKKIYLRFFDVDYEPDREDYYNIVPVATLLFKDSIPQDIEIIPTVFITNECMKQADIDKLASKVVWRVLRIADTNNITQLKEIQFDCDWTPSTQNRYFDFLEKAKAHLHNYPIQLSATIRLHQLTLPVPPVKKGVLMCYNTGNIRNQETENSILKLSDVAPYIRGLHTYDLPLSIAYPTFSWTVAFRENKFISLFRQVEITDGDYYEKIDSNLYRVTQPHYLQRKWLLKNDILRVENSTYATLSEVKNVINRQLKKTTEKEIILYHLDSANLSKYTQHEVQALYRP